MSLRAWNDTTYNLKSKRWRGLIKAPSDDWLAMKKKEREKNAGNQS